MLSLITYRMMHACRKDQVQIKHRHILTSLMSFLTEPPQSNVGAAIPSPKAPPTLSPCIIYNPKSLRTALLSWSVLVNLWTWMKNRFRPTIQCSDIDLPAGFNVFLWLETAQDSVNMTWKNTCFLFYETYTAAVILYDYLPLSDFNILSFKSR